ncbi:hypothetical protein [Pedosphaera parvula]|nr:hypothetical protein [Pedosphaera parvula]
MNLLTPQTTKRSRQSGSAVFMVLGIIALMLVFVGVNLVTVNTLSRELKLIEKKQIKHLSGAQSKDRDSTKN